MVYITLLIRWKDLPRDHAKAQFIFDSCRHHVTQWYFASRYGIQNLTVAILEQQDECVLLQFLHDVVKLIAKNWTQPKASRTMIWEQVENVLNPQFPILDDHYNRIAMWRSEESRDSSFYTTALETATTVKNFFWKKCEGSNVTLMDPETDFKCRSKHTPHEVSVLVPADQTGECKMLRKVQVRCREPQLIYDLLRKHGVNCAEVWTRDTMLHVPCSAPCSTLLENNMYMVRTADVPQHVPFDMTAKAQAYYRTANVYQVRVSALLSSFKDKIHRLPDDHPSLPSVIDQTRDPEQDNAPVTVIMRADSHMDSLWLILRQDGRFSPTVEITDLHTRTVLPFEQGSIRAMEIQRDNDILIQDTAYVNEVFTCTYCAATANDVHLACGHVCCKHCLSKLETCGMCNAAAKKSSAIDVPGNFNFTCGTCQEPKQWVSACTHIVCKCHSRCGVCDKQITVMKRMYNC